MRKILELTEKEFMTGIAPSSQIQNAGLWHRAKGISFVRDPFIESDSVGLLQPGPLPTDLTGSVIADIPWAWIQDVSGTSTKNLYMWGNAGHLYKIDTTGDNNPTDVASGAAVSNPAAGIALFKPKGGTKYLYYWQLTQIGRWDPTAAWATRTSNWATSLNSTAWHPTHAFHDRVYYGNLDKIGYIGDDGAAGVEHVADALDIEADERVNCLSDDGVYLIAGVTKNFSTENLVRAQSRIIFWDTNQPSWQREWQIPDASILCIRRVGNFMHAVTSRGVFAFSFDMPPVQLVPYLQTASVPDPAYPTQFAADVFGEALIFAGSDRVSAFGKIVPQMPMALTQPFAGFTGTPTLIISSAKTNDVFVGTTSSKLYRAKWTASGLTSVTAETIYIDLKRWWQIGRIAVEMDGRLVSGEAFDIDVRGDDLDGVKDWGSVSYASHGEIRSKELYNSEEARKLKLIVNFTGGSPRIRRIEVWGDPIERPSHTRL